MHAAAWLLQPLHYYNTQFILYCKQINAVRKCYPKSLGLPSALCKSDASVSLKMHFCRVDVAASCQNFARARQRIFFFCILKLFVSRLDFIKILLLKQQSRKRKKNVIIIMSNIKVMHRLGGQKRRERIFMKFF